MDSTRARLHFLKRVFGSRSTAGRVATPQDLSVTKQHRNDRWDRCTASAGDWQIITTTSHRSANQRYFMHNSATVHRMRMQSSALDSSRSQLCNDTSTGVVRHQITKWRRLQKVVSYDVLHHICPCMVLADVHLLSRSSDKARPGLGQHRKDKTNERKNPLPQQKPEVAKERNQCANFFVCSLF